MSKKSLILSLREKKTLVFSSTENSIKSFQENPTNSIGNLTSQLVVKDTGVILTFTCVLRVEIPSEIKNELEINTLRN